MERLISLPLMIFLPMAASIFLISPFFTNNGIVIRRFCKGFCFLHFLYVVFLALIFDSANPYVSRIGFFGMDWVQSLGITFSMKADGVGMILCVLTSFVFLMAAIASKLHIRKNHKLYYSMLLLLMSAILGIFCAEDMFLFFLFWELELIPAYFLIGGDWNNDGEKEAKRSAVKFVLFTFLGSMVMLLGMFVLYYFNYAAGGVMSSSFGDITANNLPLSIQLFAAVCLLVGFGVKLPIIPLHTWLPDAHTNAPVPVSMILAGILLKTGAYGIFRFNYEILNNSFRYIAPILAVFALLNIIYTAFVAYSQRDIKRIVAYSSISNMGLILLGICAMNRIGLEAAVFHMTAHGLVTCGLFMVCGVVYLRCKTRDIDSLGGIAVKMPRLFGFATLIVLASIGVPAFAPFIGEVLNILGAMLSDMTIVLKVCALLSLPLLIASSCYMLKFLHCGFFGQEQERFAGINDISVHEFIVLLWITAGLVVLGIFPSVVLNYAGV